MRQGDCSDLTAAIAPSGRYHVAARCDGAIRYLTSMDGFDWEETSFPAPTDRVERDPLITLDGDVPYLAYSRVAPVEGGCGDDGLRDIGVYVRSRPSASGLWSEPVRVGRKGDQVQSFRVVDGDLHLTVTTEEGRGPRYYESQSGDVLTRVPLPDARATSLRVGDDARPRIAFTTGTAIRYASVDGTRLSTETVAADSADDAIPQSPSLVLGPGDQAYIVWTQDVDHGGGCAEPGPGPLAGVYFATDATGSWQTTRLSRSPSEATLTLDAATGYVDVILAGKRLTEMTSRDGDTWSSTKIAGTRGMVEPVIRFDPGDGQRILFALDWRSGRRGIYVMAHP